MAGGVDIDWYKTDIPSICCSPSLLTALSMPTLLIPIFWVGGSGGVGKGAGKGGGMVGLGGRQSPFSPPLTFPKLSLPSTGN